MKPRQKREEVQRKTKPPPFDHGTKSYALEDEKCVSQWITTVRDFYALILPYLVGVGVALGHFFLFNYLDQKRIGIDTTFPQLWVSSVSLVLVTAFQLCLCLALGNAFTQHLWRIVRLKPVKIADFERYCSMQKDPLTLFYLHVLFKAPALYAMAVLGFSIGLAVIFRQEH